MDTMVIGSGDVSDLLKGYHTAGHKNLLNRFVSGVKPYRNAKASPIDALRTGAILEDRYFLTLSDDYYTQVSAVCSEMDVLKSTIDFARMDNGMIADFDELKSCNFEDFMKIEEVKRSGKWLEYIQNRYRTNYNQIQHQLLCTGLESANLVYVVVYSYDDQQNEARWIKENEVVKFRISRDKQVINLIKDRASIFQQIKDYYHG